MTNPADLEPIPVPRLERDGVVLRAHTIDDADEVTRRGADPLVQRWTTTPANYTRDMALEFVTRMTGPSRDAIWWAIEVDGRMAGSIDLTTWGRGFSYGAASVGFALSPWARGRGVMTRAVAAAVEHGFGALRLDTIIWEAYAGNVGSWRAAWGNGFHEFTYVPSLLVGKDRLEDAWHAVLRADEPREPQGDWHLAIENSTTPRHQRGL